MIALVGLLRQYAAEIDADFLAIYGLDLRALGTAALPWGRFNALLHRLPYDSHLMRAVRGEQEPTWTLDMHLMATLIEAAQVTNYLLGSLLQANGAKRNPVSKPTPIKRPGVADQRQGKGLASLIGKLSGRRDG
ncbi:hypothetical protein GCM10012275_08070 [Longimycelium tulufanense]|uniref:Uncharacterized protein n=1 Tax=Longimycelium tulufanense TaxID=907463 RepID=A0A8J3FST9_9PSEU|nr:Gp15 family bacteriophage protein [Longimycelium tulufanense]GGM39582.1 hypothetical protein GCM10012275_08070 [Longimycelium tulufanense]